MKTFKERKENGEFTGRYGPKDVKNNKKQKESTLFDYFDYIVKNDKS